MFDALGKVSNVMVGVVIYSLRAVGKQLWDLGKVADVTLVEWLYSLREGGKHYDRCGAVFT
jgi:hypothetical protein